MGNNIDMISLVMSEDVIKRKRNKDEVNLDNEYYNSGRWKCEESPTNAHYWVHIVGEIWRCIHCRSYKFMPSKYYSNWIAMNANPKYKVVYSEKDVDTAVIILKEGGKQWTHSSEKEVDMRG